MKKLNKVKHNVIYIIAMVLLLSSCIRNATFSPTEIAFVKPFIDSNTAIYKSEKGEIDTIIFNKYQTDTAKFRNIEQGFYNENSLFVNYKITKESFHKTLQAKDNPVYFILFIKGENSYSIKEIGFLGLGFDDEYIDKVLKSNDSVIVFDEKNACYNGVNINKGIRSFKYSLNKGVISFIDEENIKWNKIN